jgi:hypothetical protein
MQLSLLILTSLSYFPGVWSILKELMKVSKPAESRNRLGVQGHYHSHSTSVLPTSSRSICSSVHCSGSCTMNQCRKQSTHSVLWLSVYVFLVVKQSTFMSLLLGISILEMSVDLKKEIEMHSSNIKTMYFCIFHITNSTHCHIPTAYETFPSHTPYNLWQNF